MDIKKYLKAQKQRVDQYLEKYVSDSSAAHGKLYTVMRYALLGKGKRIRPILTLAASKAVEGNSRTALTGGCAVELMHTYSLIHDDLPCMDDDDIRRGKPSAHTKFDEAAVILAGDALQTLAFELISTRIKDTGQAVKISAELAAAAGPEGMAGGQILDLIYEDVPCSLDALHDLHARKTGAIITAALRIGALTGNPSEAELRALTRFGKLLGLLYQVVDDILDETGDVKKLGKAAHKDAAAGKSTFPGLLGLEGACAYRDKLCKKACKTLEIMQERGKILTELCRFICTRDH